MPAIGIDLGTTNSVVAVDDEDGPRVLTTRMRESLTPSVVGYRGEKLLVGRAAWNNAPLAPKDTVFSIKRLMGRSIDDPTVMRARDLYPYDIVFAATKDGTKKNALEGDTTSADLGDRGVRVVINRTPYTPIDISAIILKQVAEDAARALGVEKITHAVITVPAYFTEPQRAATREAGQKAGLVVRRIIDEPTAAAIAFGLRRISKPQTLLVFDLGGGTLDISILEAAKSAQKEEKLQFEVLGYVGDMWLGGDDFDYEIVKMIIEWVRRQHGVDPSNDERFLMEARRHAEEAKRYLTAQPEVDLIIPSIIPLPGGGTGDVEMIVSRTEFERRIQPYVDKCVGLVNQVMAKQNVRLEKISTVLMVGGATAVPLVRQAMVNLFGSKRVQEKVHPMHAVALGAAILATKMTGVECPTCHKVTSEDAEMCEHCNASLSSARAVGKVEVENRTALPLGIGAVDERGRPDVFSIIIPAGTSYPLEESQERLFMARGHEIVVPVYEGEHRMISQNQYLGQVEYQLPPDAPTNAQVIVGFNYDRDRVVTVKLKVRERPDLAHEAKLRRDVLFAPPSKDNEEWQVRLQGAIATGEQVLREYREFIEPGQKAELEEEIRRARRALVDKDQTIGREFLHKLTTQLTNLGTATYLLLAERMMYGANQKGTELLAKTSKSLREAHTQGNSKRVEDLKEALALTINRISKRRGLGGEIQDFGGLLHEPPGSGPAQGNHVGAGERRTNDQHLEKRAADD